MTKKTQESEVFTPARRPGKGMVLHLFVAGDSPNSQKARKNLKEICETHFDDDLVIEVFDVMTDPRKAFVEGVLVTPSLLRVSPKPARQISGDLSDGDKVILALT